MLLNLFYGDHDLKLTFITSVKLFIHLKTTVIVCKDPIVFNKVLCLKQTCKLISFSFYVP